MKTDFKEDGDSDIYIVRFTTNEEIKNNQYPILEHDWTKPPCTGTGFTGSPYELIPEYELIHKDKGSRLINEGIIVKIDSNHKETLVGIYNRTVNVFEKV